MYRKGLIRSLALAATAAVVTAFASHGAMAEEFKVRFSWKLSGAYGFFYLGDQKGVYKDAALELKLGEGASSQAALGGLIQGQEDVVVMPGIFAVSAIQRGMPVKIIGVYQPSTPLALISHPDNPVNTPKDLEGKTIAHAVGETGTSYLGAFCEINSVDCTKINKIQMDSQTRVPQFLQRQVDVVSVYRNNDLPVLEDKAGAKFVTLNMSDYGLSVLGEAIVASDEGIAKNGDALRSFLAANAKSIEMMRADPAGTAAALKAVWKAGPSDQVLQRQIETTAASFTTSAGTPVGWVDEKVIANALKLIGSVDDIGTPRPLSDFYTNELLGE